MNKYSIFSILFLLLISFSSCNNETEFDKYIDEYYNNVIQNWTVKEIHREYEIVEYSLLFARLKFISASLKNQETNNDIFKNAVKYARKYWTEIDIMHFVDTLNNNLLSKFIKKCPDKLYMDISRLKVFYEGCDYR